MTVYFPRSARPVEALARPTQTPAKLQHGGRRILVVDDEPAVRNLVAAVLLAARYWVRAARDAEEALEFVAQESEPFDLVVSDLMMPGLDGAGLARELAVRGHAHRMLFVSGYSDHAPGAIAAIGHLLAKPFTPEQLLEAVAAAIGRDRR